MRTKEEIYKDLLKLAINASLFFENVDESSNDQAYLNNKVQTIQKHYAELVLFGMELRMHRAANPKPDFPQGGIITNA